MFTFVERSCACKKLRNYIEELHANNTDLINIETMEVHYWWTTICNVNVQIIYFTILILSSRHHESIATMSKRDEQPSCKTLISLHNNLNVYYQICKQFATSF
jgi:hypothetical protein